MTCDMQLYSIRISKCDLKSWYSGRNNGYGRNNRIWLIPIHTVYVDSGKALVVPDLH